MSPESPRGATAFSSIVNTVNTVVGAGMLVLPYAFRTDSVFLGALIVVFAACANGLGMIVQGMTTKFLKPGSATFFTVCQITSPKLSILFDISIFLQCYGVGISYVVLTGDLMPQVIGIDSFSPEKERYFYMLLSAVITVPLCFLHKLDSLKYASIVALVAIAYLLLLVYVSFFYSWSQSFANVPADKLGSVSFFKPEGIKPVFKTLGVIVLAYTCPNQYSIVGELERPTLARISHIVYLSMSIIAVIFLSVAFFGYMNFGNAISGNIMLMYGNNFYCKLGRLLLVVMVLLSFPLMFHPARVSANNIYYAIKTWVKPQSAGSDETAPLDPAAVTVSEDEEDVSATKDVPLPESRFIWLTVVLLVSAYGLSVSLNSFELILSLVGATGGVLISYVLPGFYGYKLIASEDPDTIKRLEKYGGDDASSPLFQSKLLKSCCVALTVWGLFSMVVCIYSSLAD